jgi:hypothetical protein
MTYAPPGGDTEDFSVAEGCGWLSPRASCRCKKSECWPSYSVDTFSFHLYCAAYILSVLQEAYGFKEFVVALRPTLKIHPPASHFCTNRATGAKAYYIFFVVKIVSLRSTRSVLEQICSTSHTFAMQTQLLNRLPEMPFRSVII